MQSKYKIGLLRANLLLASVLPALMVPGARDLTESLLLGLTAAWLAISAVLVEFSHRRPPLVPWQLLPSLLLIRTPRHRLWAVVGRLCELTRRFEHCYRLDGRTLAALLVCRDAEQARERRETLLVRQRLEEAAAGRRLHDTGDLELRSATCLHAPGHTFTALRQRLEVTSKRLADE